MRYRSNADRIMHRDLREMATARQARERAAMTPAQIRGRIVAAILEADDRVRALTRAELLGLNLSTAMVDEHFAAAMNAAELLRPGLKRRVKENA